MAQGYPNPNPLCFKAHLTDSSMVTISQNYHHWHSSMRQFKQYLKKEFLGHVLSDYNRRNYLTAVGQRMPPLLHIACHLLFEILQQSEEFSLHVPHSLCKIFTAV